MRKRPRTVGPALLVLVVLVLALPAGPAVARTTKGRSTTALRFASSFVPQQIVADDGRVWALGSIGSQSSGHCELDDIGPGALSQRLVPIPACAVDMTVGSGTIYLLAPLGLAESNTRDMHVESFDPRSGTATVLAPVVMGIVGSGIAHTGFSYGDGSLWLYGYDQAVGGPAVVRISPLTGQPLATLTPVPPIGGIYPSVVADADGAWFAGGPGGSPDLVELPAGSSATRTVYSGPTRSSIVWLSVVRREVWAEVAVYGNGPRPSVRTRLEGFHGTSGVTIGPDRATDLFPFVTTSDGRMWTLSFPSRCAADSEWLEEVEPATGATRGATRLPVSQVLCDDGADIDSSLATAGQDVFALVPAGEPGESVLYRVHT